ncbi:UNVERIFIED_CONTAM: Ubiquitin-like domain-containing protein CIP73 [Sesamum latifolium]|uniref:Ubiquitin-like domain-containing protein CIP73 n=1 Tax=Sesamum latifolium TaxID=2727402 RepID=A0AAW2X0Y2_9LAMI
MGSNGGDHIKVPANDTAECSETTVEIKIKTLDSQTFTLRVDKCGRSNAIFKLETSIATGVLWSLAENFVAEMAVYVQREGNSKGEDAQVPVPELKEQIASVTGVLSEQQRLICRGKVLKDDQLLSAYHVEDGHTLHLVVRQPVALSSELSDHAATDQASSTGLNSANRVGPGMVVGTFNISEQGDGAFPDLNRQPPLERLSTAPGLSSTRNSSRLQSDQAASVAVPVEALQSPIIPDSLTTLLQYLSHLRQEFLANDGGQSAIARNAGFSGSDGHDVEAAAHSSDPRGLLTPESLAEVITTTRRLLLEQATECLLQLSGQLESHSSVMDPLERSRIQSNAIRSGALFQNLGALLLELGRAIMTLRMGRTPADALVNAGPSVFVSATGPNPIMVQPLPFQPGATFGSVPVGTVQHGSGLAGGSAGTGFLPRNIDIRIRAGSLFPQREPTSSQPQGQVAPISANSVNSGQQDAALLDRNVHNREPQLRAIPIRTVVAAVPTSVGRGSDSSRGSVGILYPVLARVQHVSSGNSSGTRASQASDHTEQPILDSAAEQQNLSGGNGNSNVPSEALNDQGFSGRIRGLEQLLSTIFPGEHILSDDVYPQGSGSVPGHSGAAQVISSSQESASTVSGDGILLSNILRQIMPILSESSRAESNLPSTEGASSDETQVDGNPDRIASPHHRRGPESPPSSKRQRGFIAAAASSNFTLTPTPELTTMAEQTEKAFLKQPKVFLCSKKSGKGKAPGKGGNRYWKSIGLGFKTPREAVEGTYIDKKCPFTGDVSIRGRILAGTCHSAKMVRTIIVRRNYLHWVKKYQRYEKRHSNIPAHISPCFRVKEGDHVIIGQCRPLSKTVRFNVLKVIPAGSSGRGKKAFTGM